MKKSFAFSEHVAFESLQQLQVFLSLQENTQVAVSIKILQVIWFQLKVFEFLKKTRVVFQTVQRPCHLTFNALVQLFLFVRVLNAFLFDQSLPYLKVTLAFVEIAKLAAIVFFLS